MKRYRILRHHKLSVWSGEDDKNMIGITGTFEKDICQLVPFYRTGTFFPDIPYKGLEKFSCYAVQLQEIKE